MFNPCASNREADFQNVFVASTHLLLTHDELILSWDCLCKNTCTICHYSRIFIWVSLLKFSGVLPPKNKITFCRIKSNTIFKMCINCDEENVCRLCTDILMYSYSTKNCSRSTLRHYNWFSCQCHMIRFNSKREMFHKLKEKVIFKGFNTRVD